MSKRALRIPTLRRKKQQATRPVVKNRRAAAAPRRTRASATTTASQVTTVARTMVALAIVTLFIAATLAFRRPAAVAAAEVAQPETVQHATAFAPTAASVAPAPVIAPQAVREPSARAAALKADKNRIAEAASPLAAVTAIDEALGKIEPTTELAAPEPISVEPAPVSPAPLASLAPGTITVTGCLETSGNANGFRLTDTEGGDAPKSRSWRTGFLKKRSNSVALVDPPDAHALQAQVGQRVAATGLLTNSDLRVSSLRVISPKCN